MKQLAEDKYIDLYFGDASHFSLVPEVPYAWQTKNEPVLLPATREKSTSVFGLMSSLGELVYDFFDQTMNSESVIGFLDKFVKNITKKTVLVLDNSSLHTSKKFKQKIKEWEEQDLLIYFIPPYCPELNKIEILWRFVKYKWLDFAAYSSFNNLKSNLKEIFDAFGSKYCIKFK